jgi:hypothetical protein
MLADEGVTERESELATATIQDKHTRTSKPEMASHARFFMARELTLECSEGACLLIALG